MARIVVVGDVGGHAAELRRALHSVGADPHTGALPADVVVVQVGDLVDRGPDSAGVVELVGSYLDGQPKQWIQLAGNHETQHLRGQQRFWREELPAETVDTLRAWWTDGRMNVAAAIRTAEGEEFLITHAGLVVGAWQDLGEPMTASTAMMLLNERPELVWSGGVFSMDRYSGPLWAEAGWDLYEPWLRFPDLVPFGQIHGHSSIIRYAETSWRCPELVRQRASVDTERRHVTVRVGGRRFLGIDPKHSRTPAPAWAPLILDDAEVLVHV